MPTKRFVLQSRAVAKRALGRPGVWDRYPYLLSIFFILLRSGYCLHRHYEYGSTTVQARGNVTAKDSIDDLVEEWWLDVKSSSFPCLIRSCSGWCPTRAPCIVEMQTVAIGRSQNKSGASGLRFDVDLNPDALTKRLSKAPTKP